jgi:hypothetical protein
VDDEIVSEDPRKKPQGRPGATVLVGSLVVLSQGLTVVSRMANGESFLSPLTIVSASLAVLGVALVAVALTKMKGSR